MKCAPVVVKLSNNYSAKINKYPNPDFPKSFNSTLHWHKEFELLYVHNGSLVITKPSGNTLLKSGEIYLINSEDIHSYTYISPNAQFIVVNFTTSIIQPYTENPAVVPTFNLTNKKAIANITNCLKSLNLMDDFDERVEIPKIRALVNYCVYYLVKYCYEPDMHYVKGSANLEYNGANLAIAYINENYKQKITLTDISTYVGMTPAHFSKIFKDNTSITFSDYLRKVRLENALNSMIETNISVKEAALDNGFPNVNSFISSCKEVFGKTPNEMKNFDKI